MTFSEKVQWFYRYSLKLSSSLVGGFHIIRTRTVNSVYLICFNLLTHCCGCVGVQRDRVLEQSIALFSTAPRANLHRCLRVDFMNEVGVDGGGILREWLHLVCSQLFTGDLGLFSLTSSAIHQGYWINRTATEKTAEELQVYCWRAVCFNLYGWISHLSVLCSALDVRFLRKIARKDSVGRSTPECSALDSVVETHSWCTD